jgi:hypothetical protein
MAGFDARRRVRVGKNVQGESVKRNPGSRQNENCGNIGWNRNLHSMTGSDAICVDITRRPFSRLG